MRATFHFSAKIFAAVVAVGCCERGGGVSDFPEFGGYLGNVGSISISGRGSMLAIGHAGEQGAQYSNPNREDPLPCESPLS